MKYLSLFTLIVILVSGNLFAQIELPAIFSDNMVLQQQFETPFWGWAEPGKNITLNGSWDNNAITTVTNNNGDWNLKLPTPKAGGPYFVTINDDTLHNVMIGEVWVCSGQSNMQLALDQSMNGEDEILSANYPNIRFFYLARQLSDEPQKDCHANWTECTPETAKDFSAVAYYFGKELHLDLNVPVGLIHTSWGGSSAQAWVSEDALKSYPDFFLYYERQQEAEKNAKRGTLAINQQSPNCLYNAMLAPLIPFAIKGTIWYQGESNRNDPNLYEKLFTFMINSWRDDWGQGNFPFYFVQLAPYNYDTPFVGALLRDAQRKSLNIPNTGMAVTMDIGDPDDIHPTNKYDVGKRLALWALARDYGRSNLTISGPLYKTMKIEADKIRLHFDYAEGGLLTKEEEVIHFEIAGNDRKFYPATADIEGETVVVSAKEVKQPLAVRYAFNNTDEAGLFNEQGLPASSFRTDDWLILTEKVSISSVFDQNTKAFVISIEAQDNYDIYFTTDGTDPSLQSNHYKNPFLLKKSATIKARAYLDYSPSVVISTFDIVKHLATGKKVTYNNQYVNRYAAGGEWALVNSIKGSNTFNDGNWQGFDGKNIEIIIDLGGEERLNSISAGFLQNQGFWILFPEKVVFYGSKDGVNFDKLGEVLNNIPQKEKESIVQDFILNDINRKYGYIKVYASKLTLPEWHSGAGNDAWLFVDEIVVE